MPLRIFHDGLLEANFLPPALLYPSRPIPQLPPRVLDFAPKNPNVEANPQQRRAVLEMLQGTCRQVAWALVQVAHLPATLDVWSVWSVLQHSANLTGMGGARIPRAARECQRQGGGAGEQESGGGSARFCRLKDRAGHDPA
jgi:hypothetical protein